MNSRFLKYEVSCGMHASQGHISQCTPLFIGSGPHFAISGTYEAKLLHYQHKVTSAYMSALAVYCNV